MMMRMTSGLSAVVLAAVIHTAPAQAQGGAMAKPMPMAKEKVYTAASRPARRPGASR